MAKEKTRKLVQALWAAASNSYVTGFISGKIYRGNLKKLCVPGLNCYSCPGALGACPIGALQSMLAEGRFRFSCYIFGFLTFIGALCGRFVCGWLCPFGWIQELIYKIPFFKKIRTFPGDRLLRYLKYCILLLFVILLPLFALDAMGFGQSWFCKWICPAGTLEAGIPLAVSNESIRASLGWMFSWKMIVLLLLLFLCLMIERPFCRYICPLGAVYGLFNRVSLYRLHLSPDRCTACGKCRKVCPMGIDPSKTPSSAECIRCGKCENACSFSALSMGFKSKNH